MPTSTRSKRVLLYSHDSFGLGHVSRSRTIANAIVEAILTRYVTEFEGFQRRFLELERKEAK